MSVHLAFPHSSPSPRPKQYVLGEGGGGGGLLEVALDYGVEISER